MTTEDAERRAALHEALFREVNEGIRRGLWPGDDRLTRFRCECAHLSCISHVRLKPSEYDRARQDPTHFIVLPGHEAPGVEVVIERSDRYLLVEKRREGGEIAAALDPRR